MALFEKIKLENKDKVDDLRDKFSHNQIGIEDIPQDILIQLFTICVNKLDELQNGGDFDERDWKDCLCDKEFIIDDLFKELQEEIDLGIFE